MKATLSGLLGIAALAVAVVVGCGQPLRAPERPTTVEVPTYLQGTIGQQARVSGLESVLVQGVGLVTGLDGTGSTIHSPGIRDRMLKEMNRHRVPDPERLLADPSTAVVSVMGLIPAGCHAGERFDVSVQPLAGTNASSLEGGTLMETELVRVEAGRGGLAQGQALASASGSIFVSPFMLAEDTGTSVPSGPRPVVGDGERTDTAPPAREQPRTNPQLGIVLGGGQSRHTRSFFLQLINPSERTAEQIVRHINARFPPEEKNIAKGNVDPGTVDLRVPRIYKDDKARFLNVVSSIYLIDTPSQRDMRMRELVDELRKAKDPTPVTSAMEAFGTSIVPLLSSLLQDSEPRMRFYAARTMAFLQRTDCLATLEQFVADNKSPFQEAAIRVLAEVPKGAGAAVIMKGLDAENPTARIAAYLTLEKVAPHLLPAVEIPDRFTLAVVPSEGQPFIFVSRQDKPRVVIFGDVRIEPPLLVNTPRYLVSVSSGESQVAMINKKYGSPCTVRSSLLLADVVSAMARPLGITERNRTAIGLDLSYGDVVGLIDRAFNEGAIKAPLRLEPIRFIGPAGDQPLPELGEPEILPIPDK
ncbi:MAG: flagellar basal body P-ring protein FlgI [Planctomycetes bacterium]|nr:flagellar basal body P-ring protein FlgI [Planctomycetota bacterium]